MSPNEVFVQMGYKALAKLMYMRNLSDNRYSGLLIARAIKLVEEATDAVKENREAEKKTKNGR